MSDDATEKAKKAFEDFGEQIGDQIGNLTSMVMFQMRAMQLLKEVIDSESSISAQSKIKISEIDYLIDTSLDLMEKNTNKETMDAVRAFMRGEDE
jgi:ABC-type transporter Mla subunit MlaD